MWARLASLTLPPVVYATVCFNFYSFHLNKNDRRIMWKNTVNFSKQNRYWPHVALILGQRRRRWLKIETTFCQPPVFAECNGQKW